MMFRPCLVCFFLSLNFRHSSLVTRHSSLITPHSKIPCLFRTITHFLSLNIFHTICGPYTCHSVQLFFFFSLSLSSLQYLNLPNLVREKKKNQNMKTKPILKEEEEKKPRTNRTSEKKKKKN